MAGVYETLTVEQKLRLTLLHDVKELFKEASKILDLQVGDNAPDLVAELAWNKLQVYATDLEEFAKHAKRTTINAEDIKLLVRRNPALKSHIIALAESMSSNNKEKKKRGSVTSATAVASTSNISSFATSAKSKTNDENTKLANKNKSKEDIAEESTIDLT